MKDGKYANGSAIPKAMVLFPKTLPRKPSYLLPWVIALAIFSVTALVLYEVEDIISQTKTLAGHNLDPTPWHPFPPKDFGEETRRARAYKIIQCSYLSCPSAATNSNTVADRPWSRPAQPSKTCPDFFRWIHHDLEPWAATRISSKHLVEAQKLAAFRVVIVSGKLYVDLFYACVQSRAMITIWGFIQLLKRYPGMLPDVDMMFDCMDKPTVNRTEHSSMPLPLFRYCTTEDHYDIPFPDWSFWGWPEVNLRPWDEEFRDILGGSQSLTWRKKRPRAYWKGNPEVFSPIRAELLTCNDTKKWGAQIMRQDWEQEARFGFEKSKLSKQCDYRYKIYAEGYAWSVSLKYILSCGSLALVITPQYEDFFSRGLFPKRNYWPVSPTNLCPSIRHAVDWGNKNPTKAKAIGKQGQTLMESISMDRVYDYMFHLIKEYSKLQDFKPVPPASAREVCPESVLCLSDDEKQREFLQRSAVLPSQAPPCTLQPADRNLIKSIIQRKKKNIKDVENMVNLRLQKRPN